MTTLQDLLAQKEALEQQIAEARKVESAKAIAQIHSIMAEFGLTEKDVFPTGKFKIKAVKKVAAKYRDPATGNTWSGRGVEPLWIKGKDRQQFLIAG